MEILALHYGKCIHQNISVLYLWEPGIEFRYTNNKNVSNSEGVSDFFSHSKVAIVLVA